MKNERDNNKDEYIEIDLKEYIYILWKNKLLIITILIFSVLLSFIVSEYFMGEIYSAKSSIKLGTLNNSIYTNDRNVSNIINNNQFLKKVKNEYNFEITSDNININVSSNNSIIEFTLEGNDPKKLKLYADSIAKYYVQISNEDISEKTKKIRAPLSNLISSMGDVNKNLNIILKEISKLDSISQKNIHYIQNTLFNIQKTTNDIKFNNIQLFETITKLTEIQKAEIIYLADVPNNPIEPNTKLNVAIAFVLGLFLSIFIIFMKEFFKETDWTEYENND